MPSVRRTRTESSSLSEREQRVRVPTHRRRQARQEAMKRQPARQRVKYEEDYDDNKPTPLLFKILMLVGLVLLFFVFGYIGTSWLVEFSKQKLLLKPEDRIENQKDLSNQTSRTQNMNA